MRRLRTRPRYQLNQSRAVFETAIRTMPSSPVIPSSIEIHPVNSPTPVLATADMLSDIAQCEELFHTAAGTAFADIVVTGHRETWPLRSSDFECSCGAAVIGRPGKRRAPRRSGRR